MTRPGTDNPGIGVVSSGPTAIATRYEGIGGERLNVTRRLRPEVVSEAIGMFETARCSFGTTSVTSQGILNSGSSQHGKASRALAASSCVKRYALPPIS